MPPKAGAIALTAATISSGSWVSRQIGKASTPANSLNSIALPSITGIAARGPMLPRPSTAVPSETTATVLRLIVYWKALSGSSWIARADAGHARGVGHREVVAGLQRALVLDLDLAPDVEHEGAVGGVEHAGAGDRVDGVGQARPVGGVAGLDGDVADVWAPSTWTRSTAPIVPPAVADRARHLAEHPGQVIDLDPEREAVLGARGGGHLGGHLMPTAPRRAAPRPREPSGADRAAR